MILKAFAGPEYPRSFEFLSRKDFINPIGLVFGVGYYGRESLYENVIACLGCTRLRSIRTSRRI